MPYTGTLSSILQQVISVQGAELRGSLQPRRKASRWWSTRSQQRMDNISGVNIDEEMAHLLQLQTAYGANARVMTAVREMLDALMRI